MKLTVTQLSLLSLQVPERDSDPKTRWRGTKETIFQVVLGLYLHTYMCTCTRMSLHSYTHAYKLP